MQAAPDAVDAVGSVLEEIASELETNFQEAFASFRDTQRKKRQKSVRKKAVNNVVAELIVGRVAKLKF